MVVNCSIVIPLYNKKKYILRTINSILAQSYTSYECIIIDSSNDGSTDIIQQINDHRIIHIIRDRTTAAAARNLGVQLARSEIIAFIDADDEWTPLHLETLILLHQKLPHAGLLATPYIKIRPDKKKMVMVFANIPSPPWEGYIQRFFYTCSMGDIPICSSNCAIKKTDFLAIGGFQEDLIYGEDQHLWCRFALLYPVGFSWKGPAIYHTEAEGRICNTPHHLHDDPLSAYLENELLSPFLTQEQANDIKSYIKRRRLMIRFSNMVSVSKNTQNKTIQKSNDKHNLIIGLMKPMKRVISLLLLRLYVSYGYNIWRRFRCIIHGWYIPE